MRELIKLNRDVNKSAAVRTLAPITEKMLDICHGYGMSLANSFGYMANRYSVAAGLSVWSVKLEEIASAVHDGWSKCVYEVDDPIYQTKPEKKTSRLTLANTPYSELSEQEKNKDRQIAILIIAYKKGDMTGVL